MHTRLPPTLDMTPEGRFRDVRRPSILTRVIVVAIGVAVLSAAASLAALALWLAMALIPVAIAAAAIGYGALRFRMWRARRGSFRGERDLARF